MDKKKNLLFLHSIIKKYKIQDQKRNGAKIWLIEGKKSSNSALLNELKANAPSDYKDYLRMDDCVFCHLLDKNRPRIEKQNTLMRLV